MERPTHLDHKAFGLAVHSALEELFHGFPPLLTLAAFYVVQSRGVLIRRSKRGEILSQQVSAAPERLFEKDLRDPAFSLGCFFLS